MKELLNSRATQPHLIRPITCIMSEFDYYGHIFETNTRITAVACSLVRVRKIQSVRKMKVHPTPLYTHYIKSTTRFNTITYILNTTRDVITLTGHDARNSSSD